MRHSASSFSRFSFPIRPARSCSSCRTSQVSLCPSASCRIPATPRSNTSSSREAGSGPSSAERFSPHHSWTSRRWCRVVASRGFWGLRFLPTTRPAAASTSITRMRRATPSSRDSSVPSNPLIADPASRFPLRWGGVSTEIFQPFANHNGGHIAFGPDGYLYIGMGDGGSANDPQNNAQNATSLLGKMLRIDVNVPFADPNGYRVPSTNPWFGSSSVLPEIWASGLRNPWKFSFDPPALGGVGSLIIGDVGQNNWEEVDYEGPGCSGRNYGWRDFEGNHVNPNPLNPAVVPSLPGSIFGPMLEYPHPTGFSVIGGVVYRGLALRQSVLGTLFLWRPERPRVVSHACAIWMRCHH